jgi:hypothetical protein
MPVVLPVMSAVFPVKRAMTRVFLVVLKMVKEIEGANARRCSR